jgi:hypothetical protein
MPYATGILVSVAVLFGATEALAQDPLIAARRDAQQLADCTKALDAACAAPLYDAGSYELLNRQTQFPGPEFNPTKDLARYFDNLRKRGARYTHFEMLPPHEVFSDGVRLCAFVPYLRAIEFPDDKRVSSTRAFLIALSVDQGKTWTFVDGEGFTAEKVRYIVPSYVGQPLPDTSWSDGTMD